MTKRAGKRDWRTPLLLTLSVHLMVFTLAINHRLFSMIEEPLPGPYVMKVSDIIGSDPEEEKQENDPGAAPGEVSENSNPASASVSQAFNKLETAKIEPRPEREKPTTDASDETAPTTDGRTLAERLQASLDAAGGGGSDEGSVGLGGGGSHGLRGEGKHGVGLKRHGGSGETEDAVHMALGWLVSVQDLDGKWDSDNYMTHYLPSASPGERGAEGIGLARNDIGLTGLCMLAFTGAGYSDQSGSYKTTVKHAREFLLSEQRVADGGFGLDDNSHQVTMYAHTLATFAITDLYLVTGDESLRTPMRRALEYLLSMQGPGGGWDYDQRYPSKRESWEPSTRDDLSISGWAILALVAAREANFEIPQDNLDRLAQFLKDCTRKDGQAVYADEGTRSGHRGMAMLAASNVCRRLLGEPNDSWVQQKQLEKISKEPPSWSRANDLNGSNMYYWYYGSVSMLLSKDTSGGEDRWRQWNIALKRTLLDNQVKSGARRGSFDPVGHWAKNGGGRVYATAICALNLEIYYRYEPEYLRVRANELNYLWADD
ncbi:MAG: terpene cyclase/mutase family protein [Planctomycetes bacterium]|nr:terpene cyclase/mutase family protein [Planctomycetota bacterium]